MPRYRKVDTPQVGDYRLHHESPAGRVIAVAEGYVMTLSTGPNPSDSYAQVWPEGSTKWCREVHTVTVELVEHDARTFSANWTGDSIVNPITRIANQIAEQLPEEN